ncbi:MAG TPA: lysophospholipid acyltransferase family protein [bacterium]
MQQLLSIAIWIGAALLTLLLWAGSAVFVALFGWWCDRDRRMTHWWARAWAWAMVRMNPMWSLAVEGGGRLEPRRAYVLVANHQSFADVVVLPYIRVPYKCFSKEELYRVPFFGWSLALHKHIRIRRGSVKSIQESMEEARRWLQRGMPVAFFAEGTRSRTGTLGEFKSGAFKLAIETGVPVVPLVIQGTRDALPKGDWVLRHRVAGTLTILPPIETREMAPDDADRLKERVYTLMRRLLDPPQDHPTE